MTTPESIFLTHKEAAARLGVTQGTLRFWRCKGKGPAYTKFGPSKTSGVRYSIEDITAWLAVRKFQGTTEHSEAMRAAGRAVGYYRTTTGVSLITPPWEKPTA